MESKLKAYLPLTLLLLAVFVAMMVLFLEMQPFVLFNGDDWQYISSSRKMMPMPGSWNPTRVFPELSMTFCATFSSYLIMPFNGDYVESVKIGCALFASLGIVVYVGLFYRLMVRRFFLGRGEAVGLSAVFFLFHFVVFTSGVHMFGADTVTLLFYYLLPDLLGASVVLYLMGEDLLLDFFSKQALVRKGVFFVFLYLSLISNLFASIIVAAYVGIDLLLGLIRTIRSKANIKRFFGRNVAKVLVIVFWLLVQLMEVTGGRAGSLANGGMSFDGIVGIFNRFIGKDYDILFVGLVALIIIAYVVVLLRKGRASLKDAQVRLSGTALLSGILTFVYLVLLCSRTGAWYPSFVVVCYPYLFYIVLFAMLCLAYLLKRYPRIMLIVPFLACFMFFYGHSSLEPRPTDATQELATDIVEQAKEGAANWDDVVRITVPVFAAESNWPLSDWSAQYIARSLFQHGVVDRPITIELVPDVSKNEQFGFSIPDKVNGGSAPESDSEAESLS